MVRSRARPLRSNKGRGTVQYLSHFRKIIEGHCPLIGGLFNFLATKEHLRSDDGSRISDHLRWGGHGPEGMVFPKLRATLYFGEQKENPSVIHARQSKFVGSPPAPVYPSRTLRSQSRYRMARDNHHLASPPPGATADHPSQHPSKTFKRALYTI
jgi:hypothetical protein